jgi:acetyltransferase
MDDFFHAGKALSMQIPARGKNVGIITDAGGPGIMAVDECVSRGLNVNRFSERTIEKFEELKKEDRLPKFATNFNPVDITGSGTSDMFELATEIVFQDPEIDGILMLGLHHTPAVKEDYIDKVAKVASNFEKPMVACDIGETEMALSTRLRFDRLGVPAYSSPEDTARAMSALARYGAYLQKKGHLQEYIKIFLEVKRGKSIRL